MVVHRLQPGIYLKPLFILLVLLLYLLFFFLGADSPLVYLYGHKHSENEEERAVPYSHVLDELPTQANPVSKLVPYLFVLLSVEQLSVPRYKSKRFEGVRVESWLLVQQIRIVYGLAGDQQLQADHFMAQTNEEQPENAKRQYFEDKSDLLFGLNERIIFDHQFIVSRCCSEIDKTGVNHSRRTVEGDIKGALPSLHIRGVVNNQLQLSRFAVESNSLD